MATTRLPGIYFETVSVPPPELLPRMDIAAFAGFMPSGPIGIPFMVEDPDRFQDIFGTDLVLAWDRNLNQMRLAQTPPAVRTFFRNGGTRCWVLRLARGAMFNAWTIPGLLQIDPAGQLHAGWVQARSEGSWADELTVNATLLESPLPPQVSGWPGKGALPQPPAGLEPGDLAQVFFPGTGTLAYYDFSSAQWFWFQPASSAPGQPDQVFFLGAGSDSAVAFSSFSIQSGEFMVGLSRDLAATIPPGSWLRLKFGSKTLLMQVGAMDAGLSTSASPPGTETATLTSTLAWWACEPAAAWAASRGQAFQASIVTFQLWAWPQGAPALQIAGLGFSEENPQYWGLLPTDAVLYTQVTQPAPLPYAALAAVIDNPRFPLAGPATSGLGLPLGMTALVQDDFTQGATMPGLTALDRDGLASFDQGLFIEPGFGEWLPSQRQWTGPTSSTLLQTAYYLQYQAQNTGNLSGLHAFLGIDEISMIAVPDAIHSGWTRASTATPMLGPPDPVKASTPDERGNYTVSWTPVAGAAGYTLAESSDPTFQTGVTSQDAGAANSIAFSNNTQCPIQLYYRVSAYGSAGTGPWSETAQVELGTGDFTTADSTPLEAPQLELIEEGNRAILNWFPAPGTVDAYTLQTAGDPLFESGYTLYLGADTGLQYWTTPGPPSYFRVNAQRSGQSGPWSNTVNTTPAPASPWEVVPLSTSTSALEPFNPPPVLIAVHMALLVMAAARGDQVAVLSLPYSYRKDAAVAYQSMLAGLANQDSQGSSLPTPSYGAIYHPWIVTPDSINMPPQSLRRLVPDGAVCGVIAATTLASGAWIAPANAAVENAVALAPNLESDSAAAFTAAQINLIAQQPEGFMITSQDTLMPEGDPLQPLNVRRLMILLRRLALREGVRYVFENNSTSLQRAVTRQFEEWMQLLLERGAFAGSSAQDSYQVIADSSVNTLDSMDLGRFVVELKVAPSVPMSYLTVRLVQSGGQLALVEA